ncbi:MAG: ArsR family transcriptional regulator, partial [Planctomycetota bacterium]
STVSQHLKQLKEAGLVRGTVDGPRTCYCIEPGDGDVPLSDHYGLRSVVTVE